MSRMYFSNCIVLQATIQDIPLLSFHHSLLFPRAEIYTKRSLVKHVSLALLLKETALWFLPTIEKVFY